MLIPRNSLLLLGVLALPLWAAPPPVPADSPTSSPTSTILKERDGVKGAIQGGSAKSTLKPATPQKARVVSMSMAEGLRFYPPRFEAKPGEFLQLQIENIDPSHLSHNFVVVRPGKVQEIVQLAMGMGDAGIVKGFVPQHPAIIAASPKVVDPEKKLQVSFQVPDELGVYGYVCTVPGHGMIMYGAMYVGVPMPALAKDTNIPQVSLEKGLAGGGRRPFVQRMFLPNAGPAAIAVALPGNQNFCFDAGSCSVRYAWTGPFLDAAPYWRGNGSAVADLGDAPWWTGEVFPLLLSGGKVTAAKAKFLGYTLIEGIPEFHFRVGKQDVFERVTAFDKGLDLHFRLPGMDQKVSFVGGTGAFTWSSTVGEFRNGTLEVSPDKSREFQVRLESNALLIPSKEGAAAEHTHTKPVTP